MGHYLHAAERIGNHRYYPRGRTAGRRPTDDFSTAMTQNLSRAEAAVHTDKTCRRRICSPMRRRVVRDASSVSSQPCPSVTRSRTATCPRCEPSVSEMRIWWSLAWKEWMGLRWIVLIAALTIAAADGYMAYKATAWATNVMQESLAISLSFIVGHDYRRDGRIGLGPARNWHTHGHTGRRSVHG